MQWRDTLDLFERKGYICLKNKFNEYTGIKERKKDFYGDIGYLDVFMGKLAILKVSMGTLEIFPTMMLRANIWDTGTIFFSL